MSTVIPDNLFKEEKKLFSKPQPTINLLCPNVMMICRHIHITLGLVKKIFKGVTMGSSEPF